MLNQLERELQNWFVKDDQEDSILNKKEEVFYPRTFFQETLTCYEKMLNDIYRNTADKFKLYKGIIKSLGLNFQKFDKLVDEITDLPRTDVQKKFNSSRSDSKSKKVIQSTFENSNNNIKRKNKRTEAVSEQPI